MQNKLVAVASTFFLLALTAAPAEDYSYVRRKSLRIQRELKEQDKSPDQINVRALTRSELQMFSDNIVALVRDKAMSEAQFELISAELERREPAELKKYVKTERNPLDAARERATRLHRLLALATQDLAAAAEAKANPALSSDFPFLTLNQLEDLIKKSDQLRRVGALTDEQIADLYKEWDSRQDENAARKSGAKYFAQPGVPQVKNPEVWAVEKPRKEPEITYKGYPLRELVGEPKASPLFLKRTLLGLQATRDLPTFEPGPMQIEAYLHSISGSLLVAEMDYHDAGMTGEVDAALRDLPVEVRFLHLFNSEALWPSLTMESPKWPDGHFGEAALQHLKKSDPGPPIEAIDLILTQSALTQLYELSLTSPGAAREFVKRLIALRPTQAGKAILSTIVIKRLKTITSLKLDDDDDLTLRIELLGELSSMQSVLDEN